MNAASRTFVLATVCLIGTADPSLGQTRNRFEVGPVLRAERVFVEAGAGGAVPVIGAVIQVRAARSSAVEIEVTRAARNFARSFDGWFISYNTDPDATREEIEAAAPVARRTDVYEPGVGWSAAWVVRSDSRQRIRPGARVGLSSRGYRERTSYQILSIPAGVDAGRVERDLAPESGARFRGGLLFGADVSIRVTDRVSVVPEARFVYGGPPRIGNKHRELSGGIQLRWRC